MAEPAAPQCAPRRPAPDPPHLHGSWRCGGPGAQHVAVQQHCCPQWQPGGTSPTVRRSTARLPGQRDCTAFCMLLSSPSPTPGDIAGFQLPATPPWRDSFCAGRAPSCCAGRRRRHRVPAFGVACWRPHALTLQPAWHAHVPHTSGRTPSCCPPRTTFIWHLYFVPPPPAGMLALRLRMNCHVSAGRKHGIRTAFAAAQSSRTTHPLSKFFGVPQCTCLARQPRRPAMCMQQQQGAAGSSREQQHQQGGSPGARHECARRFTSPGMADTHICRMAQQRTTGLAV